MKQISNRQMIGLLIIAFAASILLSNPIIYLYDRFFPIRLGGYLSIALGFFFTIYFFVGGIMGFLIKEWHKIVVFYLALVPLIGFLIWVLTINPVEIYDFIILYIIGLIIGYLIRILTSKNVSN